MTITVKNLNMGDSGNVVDADNGRMNLKRLETWVMAGMLLMLAK